MLKESVNKKQMSELEILIGKQRHKALPQLFFLMGISVGFLLNLAANIMYDSYVKQNKMIEVIVLFVTGMVLFILLRLIHVLYIRPIDRAEKIIKKLKRKGVKNKNGNKRPER